MSTTGESRLPAPEPDDITSFYWDAARDGVLVLQQCAGCGRDIYPAAASCPGCGGEQLVRRTSPGIGSVYSFAVVDTVFDDAFKDAVPYVPALVELSDPDGVRIFCDIIACLPSDVTVGMPVEVAFEPRGDFAVPQARPVR